MPAFRHVDELTLHAPDAPAVLDADVHLVATGDERASTLVASLESAGPQLVVDLSRAHRQQALSGQGPWCYGLHEGGFTVPRGQTHVANPGCYPTATLTALAPLVATGLAGPGPIIVDGKSGVSGAGATPRAALHFPETNESLRAYKVTGHDHQDEIQAGLGNLQGAQQAPAVRFTPHLVPQNRGLLVTAYLPAAPGTTQEDVDAVLAKAHGPHACTRLVEEPDTAHVRGTNLVDLAVTLDPATDLLVARSALDNLVKGGAGQAVQNMNLALGQPETAGLPLIGGGP